MVDITIELAEIRRQSTREDVTALSPVEFELLYLISRLVDVIEAMHARYSGDGK